MRKMILNYKSTIKTAAAFVLLAATGACKKDFFDLKDRTGMDSRIWDNEGAIQFLLNDTYDVVMPEFAYEYPSNNFLSAADEDRTSTSDGLSRKVIGTNGQLGSNDIKFIASKYQGTRGDNKYFDIARCNTAIANIDKGTLAEDRKKLLKGQFYALRAMAYFDLTRLYGGVPLVLEPLDPESQDMHRPRAKAAMLFKSIVKDLDSAITMLPPKWTSSSDYGKLTRAAAAALKGKALMYWASPQFNPVNDPVHPYVQARWDTAYVACKEAYELCKTDGYELMQKYSDLFTVEGTTNKEALIVRSYSSKAPKRGHDVEYKLRPFSEGGGVSAFLPTWNLVKAYPMNDGTPISQSADYDEKYFWLNRDPRFEASIAYNGSSFPLSGKSTRRQWAYTGERLEGSKLTGTGFYLKKFSSPDLLSGSVRYSNDFGGSGMDWIEMRFAEVIMNYAECANETGNLQEAKDLVQQIRVRAKIVQGTKNYGLDLATSQDEMRDLIMNERMVEFAFEGKRFHDLRRTRRMHLLSGQTIDRVVWSTSNKTFLETINDNGVYNRDTVDITNKETVDRFFSFKIEPVVTTAMVIPEYYYFFALPSTFMNSSPLLDQTMEWDGGTFDPLK